MSSMSSTALSSSGLFSIVSSLVPSCARLVIMWDTSCSCSLDLPKRITRPFALMLIWQSNVSSILEISDPRIAITLDLAVSGMSISSLTSCSTLMRGMISTSSIFLSSSRTCVYPTFTISSMTSMVGSFPEETSRLIMVMPCSLPATLRLKQQFSSSINVGSIIKSGSSTSASASSSTRLRCTAKTQVPPTLRFSDTPALSMARAPGATAAITPLPSEERTSQCRRTV
mmetsp:Transcript_18918/g.43443  ORF Transcript_18918/g.43443 Transcript_18918/m.43443 type:complete len:228 (-) Transcript_18918:1478-2161(-)